MIKTPYIEVAVTLPVMQTFTYRLPEALKSVCMPGMRVLVPFGKRRVTGFVLSPEKECGRFKARDVIRLLDDHPLFPESDIPFFKWIAGYYLFPLGEVIKAALPSGLDRHDVSCVSVTDQAGKLSSDKALSGPEKKVMDFLMKRDVCTLKQLKKHCEAKNISTLLTRMEKKELIRVSAVLKKDAPKVQTEKFIRPGAGETKPLRMSKKRRTILAIVDKQKEISLSALRRDVPTAPTLIRPLAEAGLLDIVERRVFRDPFGDPVEPDQPPELTQEQAEVVQKVRQSEDKGFSSFLLFGVTGSGKTEVYMRLVQDALDKGKSAIVLVPEISLISQTERRFRARFGKRIAVIHSALTRAQLLDQWRKIALGLVSVVIGARSAIFAPFENIGIIIVDEEHDASYKQESGLRYNARDLAVVRAKQNNCPAVLGSATPSVQSYQNVIQQRFSLLTLEKRVNRHQLPQIELVDLKKLKDSRPADRIVSRVLAKEIRNCLNKGNQALIFLNRRGFATSPVCRECGESLSCQYCDITMTYHRTVNEYRCHLCGFSRSVSVKCPKCGSDKIKPLGFGTQKVESMLKEMFPDARLARMDQDTTAKKGSMVKVLKDIRNRNVDIVVGTQMLAKGHDFPSITLVGVICADLSLSLPDFRAGERTFQLLAQVAGRAGRGEVKGKVVMQTYNPDHFIIEAARDQDFLSFFDNEAPFRKALMYPPFSRMVQIKISGVDKRKTERFANETAKVLNHLVQDLEKEKQQQIQILGPIEAPIQRISSRFRWQILIKSVSASLINTLTGAMLEHPSLASRTGITLGVDVDPYYLM